MMGRHARITVPIDTVILNGRPALLILQQPEDFRERTGARLIRWDLPGYDLPGAALGLALANPLADDSGLDLARTLKPPISIRDIFPYRELLLHGTLLGAVSCDIRPGQDADRDHQGPHVPPGPAPDLSR
jgi:hypothetical protein